MTNLCGWSVQYPFFDIHKNELALICQKGEGDQKQLGSWLYPMWLNFLPRYSFQVILLYITEFQDCSWNWEYLFCLFKREHKMNGYHILCILGLCNKTRHREQFMILRKKMRKSEFVGCDWKRRVRQKILRSCHDKDSSRSGWAAYYFCVTYQIHISFCSQIIPITNYTELILQCLASAAYQRAISTASISTHQFLVYDLS